MFQRLYQLQASFLKSYKGSKCCVKKENSFLQEIPLLVAKCDQDFELETVQAKQHLLSHSSKSLKDSGT